MPQIEKTFDAQRRLHDFLNEQIKTLCEASCPLKWADATFGSDSPPHTYSTPSLQRIALQWRSLRVGGAPALNS